MQLDRTALLEASLPDEVTGVIVENKVVFRQDVLRKKSCSASNNIIEYRFNSVRLPDLDKASLPLEVLLSAPSNYTSVCQEMSVQVSAVRNDGGRGLSSVKWTLIGQFPEDLKKQEQIKAQLAVASSSGSTAVRFANKFLNQETTYVFKLTASARFRNATTEAQVAFVTGFSEGLVAVSNLPLFAQFNVWKKVLLAARFQYQRCITSSKVSLVPNVSVNVQWMQISGSPVLISNSTIDLQSASELIVAEAGQGVSELPIDPFFLAAGTQYRFRATLEFLGTAVSKSGSNNNNTA